MNSRYGGRKEGTSIKESKQERKTWTHLVIHMLYSRSIVHNVFQNGTYTGFQPVVRSNIFISRTSTLILLKLLEQKIFLAEQMSEMWENKKNNTVNTIPDHTHYYILCRIVWSISSLLNIRLVKFCGLLMFYDTFPSYVALFSCINYPFIYATL